MNSPDDLALAAELRALRPTPRPEFAAELDDRAAAGFPRRRRGGAMFSQLAERFRIALPRLLAPAGGLALATVLVATVVVIGGSESGSPERGKGILSEVVPFDGEAQPEEFFDAPSTSSGAAKQAAPSAGGASVGESAASGGVGIRAGIEHQSASGDTSGPFASQTDKRAIERSAQLTLGTEPEDVRRAAGKVFESVHAYDGIVLRSQIEDGSAGEAGAEFELLIPSARLGDALASFSEIAEVRSRQEATADVTAKTVSLGERLQDSRATVQSLLAQLAAADTDAERLAAEAELRDERFRAAALRSRLTDLERRANLSRVSLTIETGEAGAAPAEDGTWGIGDALDDAGQILEVGAGVLLIALAILAPAALLIGLAWLARRTGIRRARERTLGEPNS